MIVISGCPRSGTSLTTNVVAEMLGFDRLIGAKFPQARQYTQQLGESDKNWQMRQIIMNQINPGWEEEWERIQRMNRGGFWECGFTVQGIRYAHAFRGILSAILETKGCRGRQKIAKIVSGGLANSDPRYIDRIIYVCRDPLAVAKSQENLKRRHLDELGLKDEAGEALKIKSPAMFTENTYTAARFFYENPEIPVHFLDYDQLIDDPTGGCQSIFNFLMEGDVPAGAGVIRPSQRRSKKEKDEGPLWDDAEKIYRLFLDGDFWGVMQFFEKRAEETRKRSDQGMFHCVRLNQAVSGGTCENCLSERSVASKFRAQAEKRRIDWRAQPCLFECGIQNGGEGKDVDASIGNNHWIGAVDAP